MLAYEAQRVQESEFLASGFVVALNMVAPTMQCRQVPVSRLHAAIHQLEHSAERGVDTSCCCCCDMIQICSGKGKACYMAAARVLEELPQ